MEKHLEVTFLFGGGETCADSTCPTVYKTQDGNYVFQGYKIDSINVTTPENETVIELPKEFIEAFIRQFVKND